MDRLKAKTALLFPKRKTVTTPAAEINIDEKCVRSLLQAQCPDWADQRLRLVDEGWDNTTWRLGQDKVVRVPRRAVAARLILNEQRCVPTICQRVSLPVPILLYAGKPTEDYPWGWSVLSWLEGKPADLAYPHASEARRLALFLKELHLPVRDNVPDNAPENAHRGVPLGTKAAQVEERLLRLRQKTDCITQQVEAFWEMALAAPQEGANMWLHGDLHARNILVHQGKISGIIDWGDVTSGDPASDLAAFWMLFEDEDARAAGLALYGASEALQQRARGWAIFFGAILLDTGLIDHPRHAEMGQKTLKNVSAEARS